MVHSLGDSALYRFTGDAAPTLPQLGARYAAQVAGPADGAQQWLNWIVGWTPSGEAAGYVQATVDDVDGRRVAEIAWVVGVAHQQQGVAAEAADAMVAWLGAQGVTQVVAHIHPDHASDAVVRRLGLRPTGTVIDGECRWERSLQR